MALARPIEQRGLNILRLEEGVIGEDFLTTDFARRARTLPPSGLRPFRPHGVCGGREPRPLAWAEG